MGLCRMLPLDHCRIFGHTDHPKRTSGRAVAIAFSVAPEPPSAGGASGLPAQRGAAICALGAALALMVPFWRRWRAL